LLRGGVARLKGGGGGGGDWCWREYDNSPGVRIEALRPSVLMSTIVWGLWCMCARRLCVRDTPAGSAAAAASL
jgi:hypothetical protein